ncbi:KH domain-containing protein [Fusobacterium sp. MFO224]|uniref:KH domain-containing protein n=1 Tax=Fusobacterium sp. MFO224 TaxID=3378070 RepID=UPI0038547D03
MDIRALEKTKKIGYIFDIYYDGKFFDSFDEMKDKNTVKGNFKEVMNSLGFTWAKGIQQGGRTDARVTGSNCLYVSSSFCGNIQKIIENFNEKLDGKMKITRVRRTIPNLAFPDFIKGRKYIYSYPLKKIKRSIDEINKICKELSGTYDVSEFTDNKGKKLKEYIRTVSIFFEAGKLVFEGNSFMPKQVRIMSAYILTGSKEPLPGKFLKLSEVLLNEELLDNIFFESDLTVENVDKIYSNQNNDLYIFYIHKNLKGKLIGKNGKNIKRLRKELNGNIIVREI